MKSLTTLARTSFPWVIGPAFILGVMYLLLAMMGLAPNSHSCLTETHQKISNLSGFDFEISETDCSTLGEDASISVFASKSGQTTKTLLFKYGPVGPDLLPEIVRVDQYTVRISIQRISDVIFRSDNWSGLSVNYDIGVIDYPVGALRRNE